MHQYDHGGDVYGADRPALDFSISLNPMGPPPEVLEAARAAVLDWNRYPDPKCRALRQAAARRDGVPEELLLFGNGASDLIDRFLRALRPRRALLPAPTFSEYRRGLEGIGCEIEEFFLDKENSFTISESILNAVCPGVDLVFLCDPNNPTGRRMEPELLRALLDRCREAGAFLAVDQCFLELTEGDQNALVSSPRAAPWRACGWGTACAGTRPSWSGWRGWAPPGRCPPPPRRRGCAPSGIFRTGRSGASPSFRRSGPG